MEEGVRKFQSRSVALSLTLWERSVARDMTAVSAGLAGAGEVTEIGFPVDAGAARHIGEAEAMAGFAMLEVVIDAFFLTQARDEVQIGFSVLHAVFAYRIVMKAFEGEGVFCEVLLSQNVRDNGRYSLMLEDAVISP